MKIIPADLYLQELKSGKDVSKPDVGAAVREIIENVRENGDSAVLAYESKFDKADLSSLIVTKEEIEEAIEKVPKKFFKVLLKAAKNIRAFHEKQKRKGFSLSGKGKLIGQKVLTARDIHYLSALFTEEMSVEIYHSVVVFLPVGRDQLID